MRKPILILSVFCLLVSGCKKEYGKFYDPPPGQASQIYLQLSQEPSLSTFVAAIDRVPGLKEELNSSGLFTVMAPDNEAFQKYFASQTSYKSIDDMPIELLTKMVNYHIMKWMLFQGNFLNPGVSKTNFDIYKYESKTNNIYYDELGNKAIFYPSKMLQVYTPEFYNYYHVTAQDYADVYGPGSAVNAETGMNVLGASVIRRDVASGNGVIHVLDRVLVAPNTIAQELDTGPEYADYNKFLRKYFLTYTYNAAATNAQGVNGDTNGDGVADSLWTRTYATEVNLDNENPLNTLKQSISVTAYIPSKEVFSEYYAEKLLKNFYNEDDSIPMHTLQMLYKSHMSPTMDWPSRVFNGQAMNGLGDKIALQKSDVKSISMKSNGLMYTLNKMVEPAAFTTVAGPSFFKPEYWYFAEALIVTNTMNKLLSTSSKYTVFAPTNKAFRAQGIYYTLKPVAATAKPGFFRLVANIETSVPLAELADIIGNGIVPNRELTSTALGNGSYVYPALNGGFLLVDNGLLRGSEPDSVAMLNNDRDLKQSNGYFQGIDKVIISPVNTIFQLINNSVVTSVPQVNPQYQKFKELCAAAGILTKDFGGRITQSDANKKLTLFVPSNEAITAAQTAGLLPLTPAGVVLTEEVKKRLAQYISYFFVSDQQIFTHGNTTGTFSTRKISLASTPAQTIYVKMTVSYSGALSAISADGITATIITSNPTVYPQNRIAKDGIIQIIDNAFTSQY